MKKVTLCSVLIATGAVGCGSSPLAPDSALVTISGYVYFQDPSRGEPMIHNAEISVDNGGGTHWSAATRADGFYSVKVSPGQLSITASKEGFQSKVWQLEVSADTVLNFSLTPLTE